MTFCWAEAGKASSPTKHKHVSSAMNLLRRLACHALSQLHQWPRPACVSDLSSGQAHPDSAGAGELWELRMRLPQWPVVWKVAILYGRALLKQKARPQEAAVRVGQQLPPVVVLNPVLLKKFCRSASLTVVGTTGFT